MAILGHITNPANDQIRAAITIRERRRARLRERRFLVEGARLVRQGLSSGLQPLACYVTDAFIGTEQGRALLEDPAPLAAWIVSNEVMSALADTVTPQGIVALFPLPQPSLIDLSTTADVVILDAISDPGNEGTILRTAQAAGMGAALLTRGCVDPYDQKVIRAAMGAHFALPIHCGLSWETIAEALGERTPVLADAHGVIPPWEIDWTAPCAVIVSSEAQGPSQPARAVATHIVRLPMAETVESLNAAVAAAQIMYEMQRQRLARSAAR